MVESKEELKRYISEDRKANYYSFKKQIIDFLTGGGYFPFSFLKNLRKLEYAINCHKKIQKLFRMIKHLKMCRKYGCVIPPNVLGCGARIDHLNDIIINPKAKLGNNCILFQGITIGDHGKNNSGCAQIGNNVFIGAGVSIIGNVTIGNNVFIGAGSVVTHNIQDNTTVVGNPAKALIKKEWGTK